MTDTDEISFILTSDGRLGVGRTNRTEEGGFTVIKWCPPSMIKVAMATILSGEQPDHD